MFTLNCRWCPLAQKLAISVLNETVGWMVMVEMVEMVGWMMMVGMVARWWMVMVETVAVYDGGSGGCDFRAAVTMVIRNRFWPEQVRVTGPTICFYNCFLVD
ncbi:hypothetical protein Hanom_Chr11g01017141 [Helianthus anomalus]